MRGGGAVREKGSGVEAEGVEGGRESNGRRSEKSRGAKENRWQGTSLLLQSL